MKLQGCLLTYKTCEIYIQHMFLNISVQFCHSIHFFFQTLLSTFKFVQLNRILMKGVLKRLSICHRALSPTKHSDYKLIIISKRYLGFTGHVGKAEQKPRFHNRSPELAKTRSGLSVQLIASSVLNNMINLPPNIRSAVTQAKYNKEQLRNFILFIAN